MPRLFYGKWQDTMAGSSCRGGPRCELLVDRDVWGRWHCDVHVDRQFSKRLHGFESSCEAKEAGEAFVRAALISAKEARA